MFMSFTQSASTVDAPLLSVSLDMRALLCSRGGRAAAATSRISVAVTIAPLSCAVAAHAVITSPLLSHTPSRAHTSAPNSRSSPASPASSSADPAEVAKFARMAAQWWDPQGQTRPLHRMNPARVEYIRQQVQQHWPERRNMGGQPLSGLKMLDVGCGGGLLSESLARLGGSVLGIDAASASVRVAQLHASRDPLLSDRLRYSCCTAESLLASSERYDVVCALEVVEHVAHAPSFLRTLAQLTAPGGLLFVSTLNQTGKSWLMAIVGAEYLLQWVPVGTHDWHKFLSPTTLAGLLEQAHSDPTAPTTPLLPKVAAEADSQREGAAGSGSGSGSGASASKRQLKVLDVCGMRYDPLAETWSLDRGDTDCNYILTATRPAETQAGEEPPAGRAEGER